MDIVTPLSESIIYSTIEVFAYTEKKCTSTCFLLVVFVLMLLFFFLSFFVVVVVVVLLLLLLVYFLEGCKSQEVSGIIISVL